MTQEEIIRMATEVWGYSDWKGASLERLERFAALVAAHVKSDQINLAYQQGYEEGSAHERESCAKVCEEYERQAREELEVSTHPFKDCAAAIRARSQTSGEKRST